MMEELGAYENAIKLVDPNTTTRNRDEPLEELQKWRILKDVTEILLHQIRYAMVASRCITENYEYALMITHDDHAYVIGDNRWGQLGLDKNKKYVKNPTKVEQLSGLGIIGFSTSWYCVVAWTNDGKLFMIGYKKEGQLGQGHQRELILPHQILTELNVKVLKAASASDHTICVTTDGNVYAWGVNRHRQCIPLFVYYVTTPTQIKFPMDSIKIVDVACTRDTSFAVTLDGHVYAWGCNKGGEVGIGSAEDRVDIPTKIPIPNDEIVQQIACGYKHCIALTSKGTLFAWGFNDDGELGTGNKEVARSPMKVDLPNVVNVSATNGSSTSVCLTLDGKIFAWGRCETWISKYNLNAMEPDCISFLKLQAELEQITFLVQGTRITAPISYLKRCAVFQEKLKQEWKEELTTSGVVKIDGFTAKHFQIFTNFLQTDHLEAEEKDLIDLFELANIYKMDRFRFAVIEMIKKELTIGNIFQFYISAIKHNDKNLHWNTINFIKPRAVEFMDKANLTTVDTAYVVKFLTDVQSLGAFRLE